MDIPAWRAGFTVPYLYMRSTVFATKAIFGNNHVLFDKIYLILPWRRKTLCAGVQWGDDIKKCINSWRRSPRCKEYTNDVFVYYTRKKAFGTEMRNERKREENWVEMWVWESKFPVSFPLFASDGGQKPESERQSGKGHSVIYTINRNKPHFHTWQSFNSWIKLLCFHANCVKRICPSLTFRLNEFSL